jgi:hypothetical protein
VDRKSNKEIETLAASTAAFGSETYAVQISFPALNVRKRASLAYRESPHVAKQIQKA